MELLSTREAANLLGVNEKMVYALIAEKGLPASKVTGKWLFPKHLVEQWVENSTINHPGSSQALSDGGHVVVAGSNDILLDRLLASFMRRHTEYIAAFANLGSQGGLQALRRGQCHLATSHLLQEDGSDYNFSYAGEVLERAPAVINFCGREQGLLLAPGNPLGVSCVADIAEKDLTVVNRGLTTGTRLLFDRELDKAGIEPSTVKGYGNEVARHLDVGLEVLAGRADIGPCIKAVAGLLGLDFLPLHSERFDLLVPRDVFFLKPVQLLLNMLADQEFPKLAEGLQGYDLSNSGKMLFEGAQA